MLIKSTKEEINNLTQLNDYKLCHVHTENLLLNNQEDFFIFKKDNTIIGYVILEKVSAVKSFIKEKQFDEFLSPIENQEVLVIKQVAFDFNQQSKFIALEFVQSVFKQYPNLPYISLVRLTEMNEKFIPYLTKYYSNYKLLKNYWELKDVNCDKCKEKCTCKSVLLFKEANHNPFALNLNNVTSVISSLFKRI